MENYFSIEMSWKSDRELLDIVDHKEDYQEPAWLAAIEELEKRNLVTPEIIKARDAIIANIAKQAEEHRKIEETEETNRKISKRSFLETLELLVPSKGYFFTPLIIYANVLVFIIMVISGVHIMEPSVESLISWGGNLRTLTINGEPWRL